MQITIDLPDELANRVESQKERLEDLIARGLTGQWTEHSEARDELIAFLARGPRPEDIVAFRPSPSQIEHTRELLCRNSAGRLTPNEQAELDEIARLDTLVALLKAAARRHISGGNELRTEPL